MTLGELKKQLTLLTDDSREIMMLSEDGYEFFLNSIVFHNEECPYFISGSLNKKPGIEIWR